MGKTGLIDKTPHFVYTLYACTCIHEMYVGTCRIGLLQVAYNMHRCVFPVSLFSHNQRLQETEEKMEALRGEVTSVREEGREEGGRLRAELEEKEERVREVEGEMRAVREQLEEKERLLKKKEEVRDAYEERFWLVCCVAIQFCTMF